MKNTSPLLNLAPRLIVITITITAIAFFAFNAQPFSFLRQSQKATTIQNQSITFTNPEQFAFDIANVKFIEHTGVTLTDQHISATVISLNPILIPVDATLTSFEEQAAKLNDSTIQYQLSTDGKYWSYFDGSTWVAARDCATCMNLATDINDHIASLPISARQLQVKAFLTSGSQNVPILNSINVGTMGGNPIELSEQTLPSGLSQVFAHDKVKICHATHSDSNPYVYEEVDQHSVDGDEEDDNGHGNDHSHHEGDIIPITDRNEDGHVDENDCDAPTPTSTVTATKIVCDTESQLPNWGSGGPNITSTTATSYISSHASHCHLEPNWKFQWAPSAATNPGDNLGEVGSPWTTFGPTNASGSANTTIPLTNIGDKINVREQLKSGYIGFGYANSNSNNSAEMYCSTDVINYDNFDSIISPAANNTYYCVGFNVITPSAWDHSEIAVTATCTIPSAIFTINNTGSDMEGTSQYRVYRNNVLELTQTFQLAAGQSTTVTIAGNGDTVRLEADQRPDHPVSSQPQATLTSCGTPPSVATIVATKIICDVESDLPNYGGSGGPDITSATATTFIASHPHCHLEPNWKFQWAPSSATDPGDNVNEAGSPWTSFGPTNNTGVAQTTVNLASTGDRIWMREALQTGYLSFGYSNGNSSTSAESYCSTDVLNYDNYDFILNPQASHTYYCVAWNVQTPDTSDHSNVVVAGVCQSPYAVFTITNDGSGGMSTSSQYRVYRNNLLETTLPFQLNSSQSLVINVTANGDAIRIEADQLPGHTGTPHAIIEHCGTPNQPPIANDDTATTQQNTDVTINVPANDTDLDGTIVLSTVIATVAPTHGTITTIDGITGGITYTPNAGFFGTDTFTYQICDNGGLCDTATVTISIKAPPIATDDTVTTPFQTPITVNVLTNDSDPDGPLVPSTVTVTSGPSNGLITNINPVTGEISYTPNTGFSGNDFVTYSICDTDSQCDTATVAISVNSRLLHPPIANDDSATTPRDVAVIIDVLLNDSDSDGALVPSSVVITAAPVNATITLVNPTSGLITYQPTAGFSGVDQFSYQVCDNDSLCATATVVVHVIAPALIAPIANDDTSITSQNNPIIIPVLSNDNDTDGVLVPATVNVTIAPLNGTTLVNAITGVITYTPTLGFNGIDTFTYQVCDNDSLCDTAIVTIAINPPDLIPPIAQNDTATTDQGTPIEIPVLSNDGDADGIIVPSTVHGTVLPTHGTLNINTITGAITYTPNSSYSGSDSFTYEVCDNDGLCDTAIVTVSIQPGIVLNATKIICTHESDLPNWGSVGGPDITASTSSDFLATHPDCSPVSNWQFQWGHDGVGNPGDNTGEATPATGYLTFGPTNANGLAQVSLPASTISSRIWLREVWQAGYIPFSYSTTNNDVSAEFYCNRDVLNYDNWDYIDNITLGSDYYCIGFNVAEVAKIAPLAQDDAATTDQNIAALIDVLNNDSDPDGTLTPNTTTVTVDPQNGTITGINLTTGQITYMPNTDFTGIDSFTYQICDNDNLCDTAVATIVVQPITIHLPPAANDDNTTTSPTTPVAIDILQNDTDADGSLIPSTVIVTASPIHGDATINSLNGQATYTPNVGFSGTDVFTYLVCDNDGLCDSANVNIVVNAPALIPPIANDDAATTAQNTPVSIDVLNNDSDSDSTLSANTVSVTTPPTNGSITEINFTTGFITYSPNNNYTGLDIFTYQVCDTDGLCDTATVTIGIDQVSVPPVANNDTASTNTNIAIDITALNNDLDIDGTLVAASMAIVSSPTHGTATINSGTGVIHYSPGTDFSGTDTLTYQICDNDGLCDTAIITIFINPLGTPLIPPVVTTPSPPALVVPTTSPLTLTPQSTSRVIIPTGALMFGANQFVLSAQSQPISVDGVLQITTNQPQTFYLEAKGATAANLINLDTKTIYPLIYNQDLKLWTATFSFPTAGTFHLQGQISNSSQSYSREINQIVVTEPGTITADNVPASATVTVYEQDIANGNFHAWNGSAYAQENPFAVNGNFSLILPKGQYYLGVTGSGLNPVTSRIVSLEQQSQVSANINLTKSGSIFAQLFSRFIRTSQSSNFDILVTKLPQPQQLPLDAAVPSIVAHSNTGPNIDLIAAQTKPTVIMVYGNWNTLAQEQLSIFSEVSTLVGSDVDFIPLSTMDPDADDIAYLRRGNYGLKLYKPTDIFFDQYFISSLPQFLIIDAKHQLLRSIIGPQSADSLAQIIQQVLQNQ